MENVGVTPGKTRTCRICKTEYATAACWNCLPCREELDEFHRLVSVKNVADRMTRHSINLITGGKRR